MAQYYVVINHDKREWLHPHRFGDGLKFPELCGSAHGTLAGLAHLIQDPKGAWAGDRISIVGDYDSALYDVAMDSYTDVSFDVMTEMAKDDAARLVMNNKTKWRRLQGMGEAAADREEQDFYKELFGGQADQSE